MDHAPTPRRPRRTTAEVRRLVLEAALEEFAQRGYDGASTRSIAERAGVRHSTMFRIFGSKEALFAEAVTGPIRDFLQDFRQRWVTERPAVEDPESVLRPFVEDLFALVSRHRRLIAALGPTEAAAQLLGPAFEALHDVGVIVAGIRSVRVDVRVATRLSALLVVAAAVTGDALFPESEGFTADEVVEEMIDIFVARALYDPAD